jgi:hypothetical protein
MKRNVVVVTKIEVNDLVTVDSFKWSKKYDAKVTWLGRDWAQITSDRGVKTIDQSRLTFKSRNKSSL